MYMFVIVCISTMKNYQVYFTSVGSSYTPAQDMLCRPLMYILLFLSVDITKREIIRPGSVLHRIFR